MVARMVRHAYRLGTAGLSAAPAHTIRSCFEETDVETMYVGITGVSGASPTPAAHRKRGRDQSEDVLSMPLRGASPLFGAV